jgi:hypothetical protein
MLLLCHHQRTHLRQPGGAVYFKSAWRCRYVAEPVAPCSSNPTHDCLWLARPNLLLAGLLWCYATGFLAARYYHVRIAAFMLLCKTPWPLPVLCNLRSSLRPCTSWLHIWKCSFGQPNRPLHT